MFHRRKPAVISLLTGCERPFSPPPESARANPQANRQRSELALADARREENLVALYMRLTGVSERAARGVYAYLEIIRQRNLPPAAVPG